MDKITIATRASALALWQAEHIKSLIESRFDVEVALDKITSNGDKILDKPLALIGGKGHFTKELEDAMLEGKAHLAVHSLKDVPTYIPQGLSLAAITKTNTTAIINNFFMVVPLSSLGVQNLFCTLQSNLKFVLLYTYFLILGFSNIPGTRKMYLGYLVCKFSLLVIHYFPWPWPLP